MTVEIISRKDGNSTGTVSCKDTQGVAYDYKFWLESMGSQSQPAELCVVGARLKIETKLQPGRAKPGGGNYPDEYFIVTATQANGQPPLAGSNDYAVPTDPTRESIEKQTALKGAVELVVAQMNATGPEQFNIEVVLGFMEDLYKKLGSVKR